MKSKLPALFLFLLIGHLGALEVEASVETRDKEYLLNIHLKDFPAQPVLKSIQEGYRTEVKFFIQVFQRDQGSWFPDKLIKDFKPQFMAYWDRFQNEYVIEMPDGGLVSFSNSQVFINVLAQLVFFPLEVTKQEDRRELFVNVRAEVTPIKLVAPINLLTFFTSEFRHQTPWKSVRIQGDPRVR